MRICDLNVYYINHSILGPSAHLTQHKMYKTLFLDLSASHLLLRFPTAAIRAVTPYDAHKLGELLRGNKNIGYAVAHACKKFRDSWAQDSAHKHNLDNDKDLMDKIKRIEKVHLALKFHSKLLHWQSQECRQILIAQFGKFFERKGWNIDVEGWPNGFRFKYTGPGHRYELNIFCEADKVWAKIFLLADERIERL